MKYYTLFYSLTIFITMKIWCSFLFLLIFTNLFAQLPFNGRFRLEKVIYQGVEYFDRSQGPPKSDDHITVTFATPDKNFNEQMNKKPFDFFSRSEFTFLKDSVFIRVGTSATNGNYQNETHFGHFRVYKDTNLIDFFQDGQPPRVNRFNYTFNTDSSFTIYSNTGLIATYKKKSF